MQLTWPFGPKLLESLRVQYGSATNKPLKRTSRVPLIYAWDMTVVHPQVEERGTHELHEFAEAVNEIANVTDSRPSKSTNPSDQWRLLAAAGRKPEAARRRPSATAARRTEPRPRRPERAPATAARWTARRARPRGCSRWAAPRPKSRPRPRPSPRRSARPRI